MITPIPTPIIPSISSPTWDDVTQSLYFIKYETSGQESSIFRYSYIDGVLYSAYIEGYNSPLFIVPVTEKCRDCNDLFVIGMGSLVLTIKWDGRSNRAVVVDRLFAIDVLIPSNRLAVARTSPEGHLYAGTLFDPMFCNASAKLSFYRYDRSRGVVRIFGDVISTTGIAFNKRIHTLYHLDTCQLLLTEFDVDPKTSEICK